MFCPLPLCNLSVHVSYPTMLFQESSARSRRRRAQQEEEAEAPAPSTEEVEYCLEACLVDRPLVPLLS